MRTNIVINPKFASLEEYIHTIPNLKNNELGEVIYNARNQIYANNINGVELTIKSFHTPSSINRVVYTYMREGKAKRSYQNALQLCELGVGTAEPIAFIEVLKGGLLERSYYVSAKLKANDIRWWERIDNSDTLLKNLGAFIYDLHTKGIYHKDFSPGNILYNIDENGAYNFYLIDINRMNFNVTDRGVLMQNFKCLNDNNEQTALIASYYADCTNAGNNRDEIIKQALQARRDYKRGQERKRLLKKLIGKRK